ncbi:hypothetical protein A6M21_08400 [Desulfotomaculum copahuensis]|uniref:G5 domain-containing protein n=2 Tax=Desulfotomaculum copahuensis TaxID=1838280 RepID=A0A1B7LFU8_9FIRM|nr:hypothetical protein A6M21_08400 [Desulfotomaculum copahuensis]
MLFFLVVMIFTGSLVFAGYAWARKTVTLTVDGRQVPVETSARTVADVLQSQHVQLAPRDRVTPSPGTRLTDGMQVVVARALAVTIILEGRKLNGFVYGHTVGEALKEQGVAAGPLDIVQPAPDQPVKDGMNIRIIRVREEKKTIKVPLAFNVRREADPGLDSGFTRVVREGREGKEEQRWVLTYHDGQEVSRTMEDSQVLSPPQDKIVQVGTRQEVSRGGYDIRYSRALDMTATAYSYTGNSTATGAAPRRGVVAVDPGVIPLGTRLYIEGYGYATALDRGSSINGHRIDLFMESEAQADRWGVRQVRVYVID